MRALALAVLVACGGSKPAPVETPKPAPVALDPACPTTQKFPLPEGKLRCRELPFTVDFPPGTELERADSENVTFIRANLDRGVLAVFAEPRFDSPYDDATGLGVRLEAFVKGIAADATISRTNPPEQKGATAAVGLSFTTPDGGVGTIYGYLAHGWFIATTAGGRLAETRARPDKPMGKAFLASLKLRDVTTKWEPREVFAGAKLELPLAAWEVPAENATVEKAKLYAAVAERAWIGARDLPDSPKCELLSGITDADVPAAVQKMFGKEDLQVTGGLAKLGAQSVYAELGTPAGTMVLYLVCLDPRVMLITITGKGTAAELKATIDRVTSALPRR
jgi:hypothetical protein